MTEPKPIESIFGRSWELLRTNWVIIVPGIIIGVIVGVIAWLIVPRGAIDPNAPSLGAVFARAGSGIIMGLVAIVAAIANQAYTVGMAGAAWERGTTTLADGTRSFETDAGRIVMTALGMFLLGIVAVILAIPTLGLAFLAFYLFTLYAMPAAIVGNRPGWSSISESFTIATRRFVPTLILGVLIFLITIVFSIATAPLYIIPFLGPIVAHIVTQAVIAYAVLVVVGEYLNLRAAGTIPPASVPESPSI